MASTLISSFLRIRFAWPLSGSPVFRRGLKFEAKCESNGITPASIPSVMNRSPFNVGKIAHFQGGGDLVNSGKVINWPIYVVWWPICRP